MFFYPRRKSKETQDKKQADFPVTNTKHHPRHLVSGFSTIAMIRQWRKDPPFIDALAVTAVFLSVLNRFWCRALTKRRSSSSSSSDQTQGAHRIRIWHPTERRHRAWQGSTARESTPGTTENDTPLKKHISSVGEQHVTAALIQSNAVPWGLPPLDSCQQRKGQRRQLGIFLTRRFLLSRATKL